MGPQGLKLLLAPPLWNMLSASLRVPALPERFIAPDRPCIFACLHRDILGSILFVRPARPYLLVSGSDDGRILVRTLGQRHFRYVRGATGENGGRALVALRKVLDAGHSIGLAVDGPKGPFGTIQPGGLQLARLTGATLVPLRPRFRPCRVLKTWDRTIVPYPFARFEMEVGPVQTVAPNADEPRLKELQAQLAEFFLAEERS